MNKKLITEWISTTDDLPCNHKEMYYKILEDGGIVTKFVLVRTKDNGIFTCNMRKEPDSQFIWNVLPKSTVITHWARMPKFN